MLKGQTISIAITTYKSLPGYLYSQLDSIRHQTLLPDEVVIVDDGSHDGTVEKIEKYILMYELKNWRIYSQDENTGYRTAFKTAIGKCSGDFIFLCDHDDIWSTEKVKIMTAIMDRNPDILVLCSGYKMIDSEGNECPKQLKLFSPEKHNCEFIMVNAETIIRGNRFQGCSSVIRREIKDTFLKYFSESFPHDYQINLLASLRKGLAFTEQELLLYRIHNGNAIGISGRTSSLERRLQRYAEQLAECREVCSFINKAGVYPAYYKYSMHWAEYMSMRVKALEKKDFSLWICIWLKHFMIIGRHSILNLGFDGYCILKSRLGE